MPARQMAQTWRAHSSVHPTGPEVARRRLAVGIVASLALIAIRVGHSAQGTATPARIAPPALASPPSLAGAKLFPNYRVVGLFGAPQSPKLGALGAGTPESVAPKLTPDALAYVRPSAPVIPAFELVAVVASKTPGADGTFRKRQPTATIERYLQAARAAHAMLILDVQPGQSSFKTEVKLLEPFLKQPDVGLALDPKWNVPVGVVPGQTPGTVAATDVNAIAQYLDGLVSTNNLPQKPLLLHVSSEQTVAPRFALRALPNVAEVYDVDGAADATATQARYARLVTNLNPGLSPGLTLPATQRTQLSAAGVLALSPAPNVVVYR